MNKITSALLSYSKLEPRLVRITDADADSYTADVTTFISQTGPLGATILPMTVDMVYNDATYGKLDLPETKTKSAGVEVSIVGQRIKIVSMDAQIAFVKDVAQKEVISMQLDNGDCTVSAMGFKSRILYKKATDVQGMNGLASSVVKAIKADDGTITLTVKVNNPSPVEVDYGVTNFEVLGEGGKVVAEVTGEFYIKQGTNYFELKGSVKEPFASGALRIKGKSTVKGSWLDKVVGFYDSPVEVSEELKAVLTV